MYSSSYTTGGLPQGIPQQQVRPAQGYSSSSFTSAQPQRAQYATQYTPASDARYTTAGASYAPHQTTRSYTSAAAPTQYSTRQSAGRPVVPRSELESANVRVRESPTSRPAASTSTTSNTHSIRSSTATAAGSTGTHSRIVREESKVPHRRVIHCADGTIRYENADGTPAAPPSNEPRVVRQTSAQPAAPASGPAIRTHTATRREATSVRESPTSQGVPVSSGPAIRTATTRPAAPAAARPVGEDVIDMNRDKVFDGLLDKMEKVTEDFEKRVETSFMALTAPPTDDQVKSIEDQFTREVQQNCQFDLSTVWNEFVKEDPEKQTITKPEFSELVECFITASRRKIQNEEIDMSEMNDPSMPPVIAQMMAMMGQAMEQGLKQSANKLFGKMLSHSDMITAAIWAKLGGNKGGKVGKSVFVSSFLEHWDSTISEGMKQMEQRGELDDIMPDDLMGGAPVVMVVMDEGSMMDMLGMGGASNQLLLGGGPSMGQQMGQQMGQASYGQPTYQSAGYPQQARGTPYQTHQTQPVYQQQTFQQAHGGFQQAQGGFQQAHGFPQQAQGFGGAGYRGY